MRRRLTSASGWLVLASLVCALPAGADPVLHEYFEPDVNEDLKFGATTLGGKIPAAIETSSGVVTAPGPSRERTPGSATYGGSSTPNSTDATYRIDRDTTRPFMVTYDDPFKPPITPFKRLHAYDAVDQALELIVYERALSELPIGGEKELGEDMFYADLFVDLAANTPVRIPSVGPGTRVLAAELEPPLNFKLLRDGVDNWFIEATERKRARLVMQLAIDRAVFGSELKNVSWRALARYVTPVPPAVSEQAATVLKALGLSQSLSPREAVRRAVAYFRSFAPSSQLPDASSGERLYVELALSKKGVCRHRAYAFVVTALALGIPARLIRNEAHAWVEVFDTARWHRIDLGGAAGQLDAVEDNTAAPYQAPLDPFEWPEGSSSGLGLATDARDAQRSSAADPGASQRPAPAPSSRVSDAPTPEEEVRLVPHLPPSKLNLSLNREQAHRGHTISLQGTVSAEGEPCAFSRVDVALLDKSSKATVIGALPTNESGAFSGEVTLPLSVPVGDYRVRVSTPGTTHCGPSE